MIRLPSTLYRARISCRGFTLIELLVVMLIIAIITTMVVISTGVLDDDREITKELRRMQVLIQLAQEQALFQGRSIGLEVTDQHYSFYLYDRRPDEDGVMVSQWVPMEDEVFATRRLPEESFMELLIDDRSAVLETDDESSNAPKPQIVALSSGDTTPFELRLSRDFDTPHYVLSNDFEDGLVIIDPVERL